MSRGLVSSLVGGNQLLQLLHIGSSEVGNFGLVLDVDEGRHGGDLANNVTSLSRRIISLLYLILSSNVLTVVNVHLEEDDVVHGLAHLL